MSANVRIVDWDRVVTSTPANKTAALARTGTYGDPTLTREQIRENLLGELWRLEESLKSAVGDRRKEIIERKMEVQKELRTVKKPPLSADFSTYFYRAAKEMLPKELHRLIFKDALRLQKEAADNTEKVTQT